MYGYSGWLDLPAVLADLGHISIDEVTLYGLLWFGENCDVLHIVK